MIIIKIEEGHSSSIFDINQGGELMKKTSYFIIFLSTILFLGMLYDESQLIILEYNNLEQRGYLNEEQIYYAERDQIARHFNSVEEIIEHAKAIDNSIILVFKYNNAYAGIYYSNYDWDIPLKSGRIFNEDEINMSKQISIGHMTNSIGESYSKYDYVNALSVPLENDNGIANFSLFSNVKLIDESFDYDPFAQIDQYVLNKHMIFVIMFVLLFSALTIMYLYSCAKTIIVRKFLGNKTLDITGDFLLEITFSFSISFVIAITIFYLLDPQIIAFSYTRELFITIVLQKVGSLLLLILLETLFIYIMVRTVPIKRIGWLEEYDV